MNLRQLTHHNAHISYGNSFWSTILSRVRRQFLDVAGEQLGEYILPDMCKQRRERHEKERMYTIYVYENPLV